MLAVLAALAAATIVPSADIPQSQGDPCARFDSLAEKKREPGPLRADELVALADIGRADPHESSSPFGVSPDGRQIAFLVRRANADMNEYCLQLLVQPLIGGWEPKELDRGGTMIRTDFRLRKFVSIMSGSAKVITPRWSPDGRQIAFLKREGTLTQVWIVDADGQTPAFAATAMPDSVDDFSWANRGTALLVATRPGIRKQAEEIAKEARLGYLFDERFAPDKADHPIPIDDVATEYHLVDLTTGASRQATGAEAQLLKADLPKTIPDGARGYVRAPGGAAAWRMPLRPRRLLGPSGITFMRPDGRQLQCADQCSGARQLWWSADGARLYAIRKTGWANSQTALLRWRLADTAPQEILITDDILVGCELVGDELICAREAATRPRRLVAINTNTGRQRLIYDPNPGFSQIKLGAVRRFKFRNTYGVESFADLVLPPGRRKDAKHPLVVVQYDSQGFLRGGTGDEFPIQLLAAKGFAVLSFDRPDFVPRAMAATSETELGQANRVDWTDRRNVQSSLEMAVRLAIATGTIDTRHMGISGFSDGTATVQWALINSSLFKAAAVGTCCEGISAFPLAAGPAFTQEGRAIGNLYFEQGVEERWKPLALTLNVDKVDVPLLIQSPDSEYEGGLDVVEMYSHRGKAIEMHVFAGEPHVKYQPAHRRAIYERSTEWFQFWLMHLMNCDLAKARQFVRWQAMKGAPKADRLRCASQHSPLP